MRWSSIVCSGPLLCLTLLMGCAGAPKLSQTPVAISSPARQSALTDAFIEICLPNVGNHQGAISSAKQSSWQPMSERQLKANNFLSQSYTSLDTGDGPKIDSDNQFFQKQFGAAKIVVYARRIPLADGNIENQCTVTGGPASHPSALNNLAAKMTTEPLINRRVFGRDAFVKYTMGNGKFEVTYRYNDGNAIIRAKGTKISVTDQPIGKI